MFPHSPPSLKIFACALLSLLLVCPLAQSASKEEKEKQLQSVLHKIEKLRQTIDVKEDSKSRYIKQLKSIERNIGKVSQRIRSTAKKIQTKQSELSKLRDTRRQHQRQLGRENNTLAEQLYAAYTLGRQEKVKLLFSQQDVQLIQRNLVYYEYFSNARVDLIKSVEASIEGIIETEQRIQLASQELEKSQQLLKTQKSDLDKDRKKRESIVASLDKQLKKQGGSLARLEDEANQLQELINSIQKIFIDAPEVDLLQQDFAGMKGKLPWPVEGKIRKLFGRHKPQSDMQWQGIVIEADSGEHIRAISNGRVAFADWLRGMGNLIIIDHGNSYLSLYGHNESLFKSAGEWVETGDIIGSIGSSGGQQVPGLYFEIRKKGKPENPTRWCKTGNRFAS